MKKPKLSLHVVAPHWGDRDKRHINHRVRCSPCQVAEVALPSGALDAAEGRTIYAICPDCTKALHPGGVPTVELNRINRVPDWARVKLPEVARYERPEVDQ